MDSRNSVFHWAEDGSGVLQHRKDAPCPWGMCHRLEREPKPRRDG